MVYETGNRTIDDAVERVLDGERLDRRDGLALLAQPVEKLAAAGAAVRAHLGDGTVDACSIVNAKAGDCAEDCGFCAQSAHFETGIDTYGLLDPERILAAAKRAQRDGAQRFGVVLAEKGVSKDRRPDEWAEVLRAIRLVRDETDVEVDASLGILTGDYLTTEGQTPVADLDVIEHAGLEPNTATNDFDPDAVRAREREDGDGRDDPVGAAGTATSNAGNG